jgi:hypothetical protein
VLKQQHPPSNRDESLPDDASVQQRAACADAPRSTNSAHLVHRHLVLINQLGYVNTPRRKLRTFAARRQHAFTPSEVFSAWIRFVLNKGPGDVKRWPGYLDFAKSARALHDSPRAAHQDRARS